MAIYRSKNRRAIVEISPENRLSNQVTIYGTDEQMILKDGIFFLEFLAADTGGSVTIKDGKGEILGTGITNFSQDHSPLRCDYGIELEGDVAFAKGFVIQGVLATWSL